MDRDYSIKGTFDEEEVLSYVYFKVS